MILRAKLRMPLQPHLRPTYQSKRRQIQVDCLPQVWKVDEAGVVWESVHLSDQPITVQPSFTSDSHHLHFICCWFTHYVPSFSFACVKTLIRVDGGCISYQVYTPVPGAAVCDSWYAFRPESLLHGHASGSVKTHMDIKRSQCKLSHTITWRRRRRIHVIPGQISWPRYVLQPAKLRLYLIFFMIFHQLYPTQHTPTYMYTKRLLVILLNPYREFK